MGHNLDCPFPPQNPFTCKWLGQAENISSISNCLDAWETELKNDHDREFLLTGIREGFRILDPGVEIHRAEAKNHKSVFEHREAVEKELRAQIKQGNYVIASEKPAIISPLAAIPKDESGEKVRVIHDGSRPLGGAMNDYATLHSERFQTIADACKIAKKGYWCAKLDLKAAYRSVGIHCDDYKATGLKWQFQGDNHETFLFDTRLPFGATLSPSHFHRLSQAIGRCLRRRGFKGIVVYIDDFLIVAKTHEECYEALLCLINLVRRLGFHISWDKVVGPTQRITFLGIDINTQDCTLLLGQEKLGKMERELSEFSQRKRATKRQLQRLAGLLNWACQGVRGGKFFMRRILDAIRPLQQQHHKIKLSAEFHRDVHWWLSFMRTFNGVVYYNCAETHHVHVDACNTASGAFWAGDWQYSVFSEDMPKAKNLHINYKEVVGAVQGVQRWARFYRDSSVIIHTDSMTTKAILNRGRSRHPYINKLLRQMFWLCAKYNFSVRAIHVPGLLNTIPDTVSRLHEKGKCDLLALLLANWSHSAMSASIDVTGHMSVQSYRFLCQATQYHNCF